MAVNSCHRILRYGCNKNITGRFLVGCDRTVNIILNKRELGGASRW
jgi:hypothetical protein